jgi:MFS transporter, FSR family, fosmidomycin resistance protein
LLVFIARGFRYCGPMRGELAPRGGTTALPARRPATVLGAACGTHFLHDGFSDVIYVLLPVWARAFDLSYAQAGLLRSAYSAGMATLQLPSSLLAERWGEGRLLAMATALTALGFLVAGMAGSFAALLVALLVAGSGSAPQHPLSSSLVSRVYDGGRRRAALGTYNFSGDVGKMAVPGAVALMASSFGWRDATRGYAFLGLAAAAAIWTILARLDAENAGGRPRGHDGGSGGWGIRDGAGFGALAAVHVIDNSTRTGFLTFLPFLLTAKGAGVGVVGGALMLVFAGGAVGKLACGALAGRVGVIRTVIITEVWTGVAVLALLGLPLGAALVVLPLLGIALNGTSSVLYGTVADLVDTPRRARGYAVFYTLGIAASAAAPALYGVLGDAAGLHVALAVVGAAVFLTLPLAGLLRSRIAGLR